MTPRTTGRPHGPRPFTPEELLASFRERYVVDPESGCWVWTGHLNPTGGYGVIHVRRRPTYAHRYAYEALVGPIPDGLVIDHLCRRRSCVNPAHLEPVTTRENLLRGVGFPAVHAQQTHCKRGHAFDEANTYRRPEGRECLTCRRATALRSYYARKDGQPA